MIGYLPPEPPLDPPDEEAEDNHRARYLQAQAEQAADDLWYERHPNASDDY